MTNPRYDYEWDNKNLHVFLFPSKAFPKKGVTMQKGRDHATVNNTFAAAPIFCTLPSCSVLSCARAATFFYICGFFYIFRNFFIIAAHEQRPDPKLEKLERNARNDQLDCNCYKLNRAPLQITSTGEIKMHSKVSSKYFLQLIATRLFKRGHIYKPPSKKVNTKVNLLLIVICGRGAILKSLFDNSDPVPESIYLCR